jgi:hypothetical protein
VWLGRPFESPPNDIQFREIGFELRCCLEFLLRFDKQAMP